MARRRRRTKQTVSLFPFLSILACVIGTLTLMITALALGQMDNETVASAEKLELVKNQIQKERHLIGRLKEEIARIEAVADELLKRLADARVKLEELKQQKEAIFAESEKEKEKPKIEIPQVDAEKHKKRVAEIETELQQQHKLIEKLRAELDQRKKPPEEAEVMIRPGGSGVDLEPTFVECTASGVVIYEGEEPKRARRADLASDGNFIGLLERVAGGPKATVVFLIRDDGVGTYYTASALARSRYARNGKLPVIGHGKIDLSLFEE